MDKQNYRNIVLAGVLTLVILIGWDWGLRWFYPDAYKPQPAAAASPAPEPSASPTHTRDGGLTDPVDIAAEKRDLKTALVAGGRVPIAASGLSGSINLTGGLVDDLTTNRHTATQSKADGPQRIFSPAGTPAHHFAQFGWVAGDGAAPVALPGASDRVDRPGRRQADRAEPGDPELEQRRRPDLHADLCNRCRLHADGDPERRQRRGNSGCGQADRQPQPHQQDREVDTWNVHAGPFGAFDGTVSFGPDYDEVAEPGSLTVPGKPDWIGFTDIYWMSTLIPDKTGATSDFRADSNGIYGANLFYPQVSIATGQQAARTTRLFAGAKETTVLDRYEASGIANFGLAIDWGWFRWFEKPIFWLLAKLFELAGNFGVAIILLTLIVRGVMFPIAQRQFASMAAMRAIQPKMKAIQERYKDDKPKLQEEVMALYKKEGVNPLAGCLPIFLQIPIFFALYKVLILAVEMRHQPFALWIKDLSAPDPLHILNLFGLLDFVVPSWLGIGILAVLLGITMWLQFKLNPAPMDPVQEQMFAIMPWMMMFIMAPFAAGLLIYWITSNVLTIAQQKYLYAQHPQLKAQGEKEAVDAKRAREREA